MASPSISVPRRLLVTGGCGFIGTNFVRLALEEDWVDVLVNLDALTYAGNTGSLKDIADHEAYHLVKGDVRDRELVASLLASHGIEAVVHLAAESHVDRSIDRPQVFIETNVCGTYAMLEASLSYWRGLVADRKQAFRFVHVSTDEVYGSLGQGDAPFHESTPYRPNSPYAASKAGADHLARAYHETYGLPVMVTNCSNNYGPYQFPEKLIPLMVLNAMEGRPLPIYGTGENIRDWLFVADHCRGLRAALESGKPGHRYHFGGNCERTNMAIVDLICGELDRIRPLPSGSYRDLKTFVPDRPGHDFRYAMNADKAARELDWRPQESFESGLSKTLAWYLEEREWWQAISQKTYDRRRLGTGQEGS